MSQLIFTSEKDEIDFRVHLAGYIRMKKKRRYRRKAGYLLVRECKSLRNCLQVEAKITKGYKLPEITVIHTVGPNCSGQEIQKSDKDMLRKCYQNCLKLCDVINLSSIAFCLISCGEFGYDVYVGTQISLEESTNYLRDKPDSSIKDIIFTAFDPNDANIFDRVFEGKKRNN
ncbi:MAG: putative O-acetyl-ADP-ribose deacetylase [Streblomastix strix]|uniref:Putative O-acetyl-ADP-ribose deacetylase n=1 Tax=Streblomastix strix TaxID=222440 RepID=A0A5J4W1H6_9EUKA|nr:MAG: putative O-acetyl-ADP-ribose deacetylase [Streblomastix strix]